MTILSEAGEETRLIESVTKYSWACRFLPRAAAYSEMQSGHKPTAGPPGNLPEPVS